MSSIALLQVTRAEPFVNQKKKMTCSSGTVTRSINKIFKIFFKIEIEHHESSRKNVPFMPIYFCNAGVSAKD